ncbi:peroxisomal acyl-coenzyme A oxidase 3 isoform X4 [Saimiri boliviensis]|uniref:peroxisomal acyl-coenzyme A oxidase 3 isoform X4 n=1 Tax=Saimiri boliviensis TaxID=27679 RepID=UPI003D76E9F1
MAPTVEGRDATLFPEFPRGPLDTYRARASFSWKELALFTEGEDVLRFKKTIFSALEIDPLFARSPGAHLSLEKYRELNFLRCKRIFEYDFLSAGDVFESPLKVSTLIQCLGMYDWSLAAKYLLHTLIFGSVVVSAGSERHFAYIPKIFSMEIFGCFALTELSHGSNTKAIRTTAHYNPATEEFIIHSPDFEAAKFWVGNMGKTATHAVVFAQLHVPGGQCHGLHPFIIQQWRLLPYLAAAYALDHFSKSLFVDLVELQRGLAAGDRSARQAELGREIHALASAGKPLASWTAQQGIQECREACGGHGYLAVNRLGVLRDDNDPNCTYEGDNNVLLQQTSNYLLGLLACRVQDGACFCSPLKSVDFLDSYPGILDQRFEVSSVADCLDSAVALAAYKWLVCYLLRETHEKLNQEKRSGSDDFEARNNCQVFHGRPLALAFMELTVLQRFHEHVHQPCVPPSLRAVLGRLSALYALWSLNCHAALLYRGGYFSGEQAGRVLESAILTLCSQLKDDAVALVDVIAPPDFILDSPIGRADGEADRQAFEETVEPDPPWREDCRAHGTVCPLQKKLEWPQASTCCALLCRGRPGSEVGKGARKGEPMP